jgi:hypothetical protein
MQRRTLSPHAPMGDLNIREYTAIRILAGLVASNSPGNPEAWAEAAVWYADALMTELNFVEEEKELTK